MHFLALAVDYDGTIAESGNVPEQVCTALATLRDSGRKLLLITGRELQALKHHFDRLDLFDLVVAENGALLYDPRTDTEELIADSASTELVQRLREKGVSPLSVGRSVIATWHPFEGAVITSIRELGLELQMTFNKDAVMVLPSGVNKASGLSAALLRLGICELNVVGVGDAENDHAFLAICGCAAAVNNAIESIKAQADICLRNDHGQGVCELIDMLLEKDAALVPVERIGMELGQTADACKVWLAPESVMLVIGNSGSGKSSYVTWLTERMVEARQGFCIIDPEGDYLSLDGAVTVGGLTVPPTTEESLHHLLLARLNVVVSTLALDPPARVQLFGELLPFIQQLRSTSGRPYWLVVDEAHYMLPHCAAWPAGFLANMGAVIVALDFDQVCPSLLEAVDVLVTLGSTARELVQRYAQHTQRSSPEFAPRTSAPEYCFLWELRKGNEVVQMTPQQPQQKHHRHSGKYAVGDVGDWHAFYFPSLDQRASNLAEFLSSLARLDDGAFCQHREAGDFSNWFREVIRDDVLANETHLLETDASVASQDALARIARLVQARYHLEHR
ncbi:HAD-IIB family hydrolase [Pseudomonas corrugata]|jgi:HAD superfamily hydrolase (TIGR01484 family)|uniref:HAD-IIB family hydrolase n=1 Tax=Pseudomonas corrugata TaxID=47879 RepID=A0A8B6UIP1_9PSED|nr:HAD-IIB family hydrolase [Pseudomonas corrugata]MDU9022742.1 HAD-IIB family hydrolase [Pseudomonas corrugata]MDU9037742.1 HAD-IIB family hydrolase [Pseudomonas corrugata]MDU9038963.1 HAD-IIB family hydrolase [Pseudomonas corrugata]QTH11768.1 HAD-IIB family hydrolase [Pseudomonas corrugata]UZE08865.1 HAD-IIB family hydrolase [Pseudomonas corrugata]